VLEGDTYRIHRLQLGPMSNLVYLVEDRASRRAALVDPAWDLPRLLDRVETHRLLLTDVLLTHGHDDHVNGLAPLLALKSLRIQLTGEELDYWSFAVQGGAPPVPADRRSEVWYSPPPERPRLLVDGDRVSLGATEVEVLHTPGHSPGSACYRVGEHLITGDTLFVFGCGRCDLPGGDPGRMYHSLSRLKERFSDSTRVLPGHHYGTVPDSTMGEQRRGNPFLHFDDPEAFIDFRTRHNRYRQPPYRPVPAGTTAW
jgi:glyoxylase-like metal-dependent hydrolase (beta-lactamase superfamily II)